MSKYNMSLTWQEMQDLHAALDSHIENVRTMPEATLDEPDEENLAEVARLKALKARIKARLQKPLPVPDLNKVAHRITDKNGRPK